MVRVRRGYGGGTGPAENSRRRRQRRDRILGRRRRTRQGRWLGVGGWARTFDAPSPRRASAKRYLQNSNNTKRMKSNRPASSGNLITFHMSNTQCCPINFIYTEESSCVGCRCWWHHPKNKRYARSRALSMTVGWAGGVRTQFSAQKMEHIKEVSSLALSLVRRCEG